MADKIPLHEKMVTVAWGDMDALGHVNHARYFEYFQQARIEWLESQQLGLREHTGPVVIQASCTFLKPIIYPASLCLKTALTMLGRSSVTLEHILYQNNVIMAQALCKLVWVDYKKNVSIVLPEQLRTLFEEMKEP